MSSENMSAGPASMMDACIFPTLTDGLVLDSEVPQPSMETQIDLGVLSSTQELHLLAAQHNTSLSSVFNAAWAIVVGRYLGIDSVSFVTVTSADADHNGGVCRVDLPTEAALGDILRAAHHNTQRSLDVYRRTQTSALDATSHLSNSAVLFQAAGDNPLPAAALEHVAARDRYVALFLTETESGVSAYISHSPQLITAAQAVTLADSFAQALLELVQRPEVTLANATLVSQRQLAQLWRWNDQFPQFDESLLHNLIDAQASLYPHAQAVSAHDGSLSYAQLRDYSDRLAHHLVTLGARRGVIVPFCFEKSVWVVVAQVAIAKAGAAMLAIDPKQPKFRTAEIIERVGASVMVASRKHELLWTEEMESLFVLDADSIAQLPQQQGPPPSAVSPSDMLYLIFTSGSTGQPKGCVVEHRNFCSAANGLVDSMQLTSSTRTLQNTPYTFDVSMFELHGTLIAGGCLCIPSEDEVKLGLTSVINEYSVSFTFMTPSLSRFVDPADVPTLKSLVLGGEALTRAETKTWAHHVTLMNGYGPTECSVAALTNVGISSDTDPANIGKGLDSVVTWVVDAEDHNQLVPIGAVGELVIQGPLVARGYFRDQDKTDEVFFENPSFLHGSYLASHRLYKTGDLVRYNSDGTIQFIGRKDSQVKVRGQRIELSEIDHHLASDNNIRTAAVLLPKIGPCAGNLVAVIDLAAYDPPPGADEPSNDVVRLPTAQRQDADAIVAAIKERLSARVPVYMVPTFFVVLSYTPVTSSGKTNRKLLTAWLEALNQDVFAEIAGVDMSVAPEAPTTEMQSQIQEVWADVLRVSVSNVAVNRSFISLGGDSITAIQVSIRCRAHAIYVTVADVLQSTSLKELADRAGSHAADNDSAVEVASAAGATISNALLKGYDLTKLGMPAGAPLDTMIEDAFGTSPMQQGILLAQARNNDAYRIRQIFRGSFSNGASLNVDQLRHAWNRVVEYHAGLRTVMVDDATDDSSFHQVVLTVEAARAYSPELKHLVYPGGSAAADEDVLAFLKSQEPRIPQFGPQAALTVCTLPAALDGTTSSAFFCMVEINHALIDGGAYGTVLNDLATAYDGGLTQQFGPRYHDLIAYVESKPEAETMSYWQNYLTEAQPCIVPVYGGDLISEPESCVVNVDFQKGAELLAFCRERNVTPANVLQTAWSLVLRTLTNSDDVMFGYITSGRDVPVDGIDRMVGICSNLTIVRLQMSNKSSIGELVQAMQSQYFASLEHQHLSLARLQSSINMAGLPLFNTIMSLQRAVEGEVAQDTTIAFNHTGDADPTDFDLAVGINVGDDNVSIQLGYWTNITSEGEVNNVASTFAAAISAVMSSAESTAQEVDLFSERDSRLIWQWNSEEPPAIEGLVHEQISSIARRQPFAPAIASWEGDFTFGEVEDLSTRLAHHLVAAGVKPGMTVPFCFNKSAWATITAIAIMKAGAAFIGTSPSDPPARLQSIIEDADAKFVTAPMQHASVFADIVDKVIVIDPAFVVALPEPTTPLPRGNSSDLAYLSFTSGSTGKPKGIKVQHGSLLTSCFSLASKVDFGPHTRILQFAAYAFDAHIAETIIVLTAGGCFCVPSDEERTKDPAVGMRRMDVNFTFLTPQVSKVLKPEMVPTLETIVLGGEAVTLECVRPWLGVAKVLIAYGPTETTICAAVSEPLTEGCDPLNLGHACGCRMWIVDADNHNNLVPIGAVGELLIEGRMVAEGYVNREEQTKEVFVENPDFITSTMSPNEPARRFYRSGDLCRYNPDGTINYLGRKDTQVKVRGLRIELGEIEHAILNALGEDVTSHVSVDAVDLPQSGQTLVAFLHMAGVQSEELFQPVTPELKIVLDELEKALNDVLPGYMVPSLFVPLGYVPMGLTGKVDRKQLRKLLGLVTDKELAAFSLMDGPKVAPTTPIGLKLQSLWANVLKRDASSVGVHDSFFRLGGDSISAMHLSAAMRNAGLALRMADIFRSPILKDMEELVQVMDEGLGAGDTEPFSLVAASADVPALVREVATACHVLPDEVEDIYPCTPLQEGLVAISTRLPGAYMMQNSFELTADIDIKQFQQAWQQMMDASAIHRTRVVMTETMEAYQIVLSPRPIEWTIASTSVADYLAKDKLITTAYGQPLSRFALVESAGTRTFVWSAHHATYDGWSLPRLFDQVERIYRGEIGFPMVDVQFSKFIQYLQVNNGQAAADFWKEQLKGEEPASFPRLPNATYQPQANSVKEHTVHLGQQLKSSDITFSTVIKAAWTLLLARYLDNADDVLYGQTLAGRDVPLPGVEDMQGPTITSVPVKVHINREMRVPEFLETVQRQSTETMPYEHYGLRNIRAVAGASAVDFKNLLIVHTVSEVNGDPTFLGMKPLENVQTDFDTYALVMECSILDNGAGVVFHAAYDSNVLAEERVERLMHHFEAVLQQLTTVPNVTLDKIDLLSAEDERQIFAWNEDAWESEDDCIHSAIERQAARTPDRLAIDAHDGQLTFAEVDDFSSRLAHFFSTELGIRPEVLVPMCFDKSAWTVVTMLANLKAGGGQVMLNPDHPVARLQDIIETTDGKVILCAPEHRHLFDTFEQRVVAVDKAFILSLPATHIEKIPVAPHNAAIVVFTSGSTGKPKGIALEHRNVMTVARHHCPPLGFHSGGMRVLQFAHFTFDMSNAEIYCVMMYGGTVCIATEHDRINNLGHVVTDMRIDWLLLTPTVAGLLDPKDCPDLQTLVLIGEAVDQACVDRWGPYVKLINSYGPSEATMWTSHAVSGPGVAAANIGRGFGGRMWVAEQDDHNRLTPLGCVGELVIDGPIVARHYIKEPTKTAAVFIDNPTWLVKAEPTRQHRVYKTGDLVKLESDGTMLFLGRKDSQVKLNGQRLELGEIEHNVRIVDEVETAMVILPKVGPCKGRLTTVIAFKEFESPAFEGSDITLLQDEYKPRAGELLNLVRAKISEKLPPYMVPTVWVVLGTIPVTPSRKINRSPLGAFILSMSNDIYLSLIDGSDDEAEMPTNDVEAKINEVWSTILNLTPGQVGITRSFVGLGGDSITAMQVVSRCRNEHGIDVTVKDILQAKGVASLAAKAGSALGSVLNVQEEFDSFFALSPVQQLYFDRIAASQGSVSASHQFNQSVLFRLNRDVQPEDVKRAVHAVVSTHSMLRAVFARVDGVWMQKVRAEAEGAYDFAINDVDNCNELMQLVAAQQSGLDIENGPLFKVTLYNKKDQQQHISLVAHHLVVDAVSWRVILQNIEDLVQNSKARISAPSIPFQVWTKLQEERAAGLEVAKVLPHNVPAPNFDFWGLGELVNVYGDVAEETFVVDAKATELLMGDANNAYRTEPVELMLSAIFHSFNHTFVGRPWPTVFNEGHGRESWNSSIDIANTVGWFTTFAPVHVNTSSDSISRIVRHVKDTRRQMPDNGFSYFAARHFNQEARETFAHHGDMEIVFNYLGKTQQFEREDSLFQGIEAAGFDPLGNVGPNVRRMALFEISAVIKDDCLQFSVAFNRRMNHRSRIRSWIYQLQQSLSEAAFELAGASREFTLSDFPLLSTDYANLKRLTDDMLPKLGVAEHNIEDVYPCSPIQEGMLLSQARQAGSYLVRQVARVQSSSSEPVDVARLQAAWQLVVDRHPVLRTIFLEQLSLSDDNTHFHQLVLKEVEATVQVLDYSGDDVVSYMEREAIVQYDSSLPAHQVIFCQTAQNEVYCLMELSHALIDGTSLALVQHDLVQAYQNGLTLESGPLYSNYIGYLQSQDDQADLNYWTGYLVNIAACQFPRLDFPAVEVPKPTSLTIDLGVESALHAFCETQGVTVANVFQAAWSLVLRAYTGSDEVAFGYLASGRDIPLEGINSAVGPFINTLICRMDMDGLTPKAMLQKVSKDYLDALPFQHTSLAKIQRALGISGLSLFNTIISLQRLPADTGAKPALTFDIKDEVDPTEYDIVMQITTGAAHVELNMTYWNKNMTDAQAGHVAATFRSAIAAIMATPDTNVEELNLFAEEDRNQIIEWNGFTPPAATETCLHWLIERQATKYPNEQAICSWDAELTYAELSDLSNRLSHHLASLGVGPEVLVPLCFEKSAWTLVTFLSVLKAGGCCVTLNPNDPQQRLDRLVSETEASVMLTTPRFASKFMDSGVLVIPVDRNFFYSLPKVTGMASRNVKPSNKAVVMFTSGSTGVPKGIVAEHRSLSTVAVQHAPQLGLVPGVRALQFAAYTWDVSTAENYFTLANGGCVCIPSDEERMNDIAGAINRTRANWTMITPTVSSLLTPANIPTMKAVVLCGEPVPASEIAKWEHIDFYISYGPAECSVATTLSDRRSHPQIASSNIGHGIGARLWIANPANHNILCPVGTIGELLIEGPIVTRGYLNDAEKTTEAYITNPLWIKDVKATFSETTRLYKTGDLVRYNADGTLSIFGRKDTQVKISGQRTELSEIESQMRVALAREQMPFQAVVDVIKPLIRGEKKILAAFLYKTASMDATVSADVSALALNEEFAQSFKYLQTTLRRILPFYMVPTVFVPIDIMPYTTSLKINRKVLRNMGHGFTEAEMAAYGLADVKDGQGAPLSTSEQLLSTLWAKALGFGDAERVIDREDNFFRMGGDSLAAMKLVSAAREVNVSLTVADIFKHQELSAMAEILCEASEEMNDEEAVQPFSLLPEAQIKLLEDAVSQCGISAAAIEDMYPTTPLQEGLMAISTRQPGAYVLQDVFRLPRSLDLARFQAAWEQVVAMHPILRSRIITTNVGALQVVVKEGIEWQTSKSLAAYLAADKKVAIEYGSQLARYAIIGDAQTGYSFVWTAHHAIYDGFTQDGVYQQVQQLYSTGAVPTTTPYSRFIQYLTKTVDAEDARKFWEAQFSSESVSFPTLPNTSYKPQPTERMDYTVEVSRREGSAITTATLLRAAWAIVTGRHADSDDVVFGLTLSGRNAPVAGIERMMGPMITTLPLRIVLDKSESVTAFLAAVQSQATEMIPYEHTGLQNIKTASPAAREAVNFQNLLVIQPAMGDSDETPDLGLERVPSDMADFDTYPLVLECSMGKDSVKLQVQYDEAVLSSAHVERMIHHLEHVMQQLAEEAQDATVGDISLLSAHDQQQLTAWNGVAPSAVEITIHDKIAEQIRVRPDAMAVEGWDASFTYSELDTLSDKLAHYLGYLGVGPDSKLPLAFPKSSWTVVAMLGALKAGAAVTLLNPDHPLSRLQNIFEDLEPTVLLTDDDHVSYFEEHVPNVFAVNAATLKRLPKKRVPVNNGVLPSDLAFVNYTSGTTGRPKGILIEHRSIVTSLVTFTKDVAYTPETRVLQYASYTFDVSISEILCALMNGATLCVLSEEERMNDIAGGINRYNINLADLTPTVAMLFTPEQVPSLKTLTVGGEALTRDAMNIWAGHVNLINAYGPAECSISTCCSTDLTTASDPSNIGCGKSCLLWVVEPDNHNKLAPIGTIGELLVEGPIVARGYLNRADKTAEAFVSNPAWAVHEEGTERRMYCTGDLVRYDAEGSIRYVGRKDTQVKIHGQRVEVGEIEFNVAEAAKNYTHVGVEVVKIQARGDAKALVAFLANESDEDDKTKTDMEALLLPMSVEVQAEFLALQTELYNVMPAFMVPSMFVPMKRLPIHSSGKLDRKELQLLAGAFAMDKLAAYSLTDAEANSGELTEAEETLQAIWAGVLRISADQIGGNHNFFRLGGDSIAAMKLAAELRNAGQALSVVDIYANPTLAQMAVAAASSSGGAQEEDLVIEPFALVSASEKDTLVAEAATQCNITEDLVEDLYPCTPLQEGLITLSTRQETAYINRSVYRLPETLDIARYQSAWETLTATHPILRTRIISTGSHSLQVVLKQGITWEYASSVEQYIAHDKTLSMTYGTPLARYAIVSSAKDQASYFIWTAHHSIYDGWSEATLFGHVERYYQDGLLPDSASFNTFIHYLVNQVNEEESDAFWRTQVMGDIPSSYPKLPSPTYEPTPLAVQQSTVDITRNAESSATLSTVIRAAWAAVLGRWSNSEDIVYGLTLAGRNAPVVGIADMVGPTITTVPVRVRLGVAMEQPIASFMEQIETQATQMMPFEHAGLQRIRRLGESAEAVADFKNLLVLQPVLEDGEEGLGLVAMDAEADGFDTFALVVECMLGEDKVEIGMRYDEKVVSSTEIGWLMGHFQTAIQHMSQASTTDKLNQLQMFGEEDKRQLKQWNPTYPALPEMCVHDLFKQQAREKPDQEAIHAWDAKLTYKQLDEMSTQLSYYLGTLGVASKVIVPLCFDKSAWAVVAMLAVIKAGGACVSLNPEHPISRLQEIADDVQAQIIISAPQHAKLFDAAAQSVIPVGTGCSFPVMFMTPANVIVRPEDPVFVVMTSGSTGKPKGVVLEHRAMSASMRAHGPLLDMQGRRVLQFAAYTFDISIAEMFTTLSYGGTVCVPSEEDRMNNLAQTINEMNVNWACLTPTVANLIKPVDVPNLKTLVLSGEAPTKANLMTWADSVNLINAYGPSESSIWSGINKGLQKTTSATNIGYGSGSQLWIAEVEDSNRLVPLGCVGELLIDGPILAQGYHQSPEKTASVFIESPAWANDFDGPREGRRMYRTGDLAKYNVDGTIDYLGRKDAQSKLYGQRMEMGEIEYHIKKMRPDWLDMAAEVIALTNKKALVAFIMASEATAGEGDNILELTAEEQIGLRGLQDNLLTVMPSHMVPSIWVPVRELPQTTSGKLDRKTLRTFLQNTSSQDLEQYSLSNVVKRAPETEAEKTLAALWAKALSIPESTVGIDDTFFRLGGDSIIAMRLVSLARAQGITLTVATIFRQPRLADLAAALFESAATDNQATSEPAQILNVPGLAKEDYEDFLEGVVYAKTGVEQDNIQAVLPTTDFQSLALTGGLTEARWMVNHFFFESDNAADLDRIERAFQETVKHNEILRTVFVLHQAKFLQVVLKDLPAEFDVYETDEDLDTFTKDLVQSSKSRPLLLEEPLTRFYVIQNTTTHRHRIMMRISHAQYDGVSLPYIWQSYKNAYENAAQEPMTGFSSFMSDYMAMQTDEGFDYWRNLLQGSSMTDIVSRTGPNVRKSADKSTVIQQKIPYNPLNKHGITFATMLKSAWAVILSHISGRSDVVFGHTISGRSSGAADVVGPCLNAIPVRVPFQSGWTLLDLMNFVQDQQLANIPYENVGSREIIKRCTDWAEYGYFNSVVQHQNIDPEEDILIDGHAYQPGWVGEELDLVDLGILTMPMGDEIEVNLMFTPTVVPETLARQLLSMLCDTLLQLSASPQESIPASPFQHPIVPLALTSPGESLDDDSYDMVDGTGSGTDSFYQERAFSPMPLATAPSFPFSITSMPTMSSSVFSPPLSSGEFAPSGASTATDFSVTLPDDKQLVRAGATLDAAWRAILGRDARAAPAVPAFTHTSSFFQAGGDMISATKLALVLQADGYPVTPENIVFNPTFEGQMNMLAGLERV